MRWLSAEEAALWLGGISIGNVRVLAHRDQWRRRRRPDGHMTYSFEDVTETRERRLRDKNTTVL